MGQMFGEGDGWESDPLVSCRSSPLTYCPRLLQISIDGLPTEPEWPTKDQLKQLLITRSGRPVSMQDIESDVFTLLSTGNSFTAAVVWVGLDSCWSQILTDTSPDGNRVGKAEAGIQLPHVASPFTSHI